jgi:hypothetical protein
VRQHSYPYFLLRNGTKYLTNAMSEQLHEARFVWPHDAESVIMMGSFDNWSSNVRLTKGSRGWEALIMVNWDTKILYKFLVDGRWATADNAPTETDWSGNLNNIYYSPRKPEEPTSELGSEPATVELASPAAAGAAPGAAAFRPSTDVATEATGGAASTVAAVVDSMQAGAATVAQAAQDFAQKILDQSAVTPLTTPAANANGEPMVDGVTANGTAKATNKVEEAKSAVVEAVNGVAEQTKAAIPESLVADKPPPAPVEALESAPTAPAQRTPGMPIVPLGHPIDTGSPPASTSIPETTVVPGAVVASSTLGSATEASTHAPVNFNKESVSPPAVEDKPIVPEVKEAEVVKSAPVPSITVPAELPKAAEPEAVKTEDTKPESVKPETTAQVTTPSDIPRPVTPKKKANGNGTITPPNQEPVSTNGTPRLSVVPITPQKSSGAADVPETPASVKSTKSSKTASTPKRTSFFGKVKNIFGADQDKKEKRHSRSVSGST